MPLFFTLIAAGIVVGYVGLTGHGTLTLIGILLIILGILGSATTSARRRERDRRADQADRAAGRLPANH